MLVRGFVVVERGAVREGQYGGPSVGDVWPLLGKQEPEARALQERVSDSFTPTEHSGDFVWACPDADLVKRYVHYCRTEKMSVVAYLVAFGLGAMSSKQPIPVGSRELGVDILASGLGASLIADELLNGEDPRFERHIGRLNAFRLFNSNSDAVEYFALRSEKQFVREGWESTAGYAPTFVAVLPW